MVDRIDKWWQDIPEVWCLQLHLSTEHCFTPAITHAQLVGVTSLRGTQLFKTCGENCVLLVKYIIKDQRLSWRFFQQRNMKCRFLKAEASSSHWLVWYWNSRGLWEPVLSIQFFPELKCPKIPHLNIFANPSPFESNQLVFYPVISANANQSSVTV